MAWPQTFWVKLLYRAVVVGEDDAGLGGGLNCKLSPS